MTNGKDTTTADDTTLLGELTSEAVKKSKGSGVNRTPARIIPGSPVNGSDAPDEVHKEGAPEKAPIINGAH